MTKTILFCLLHAAILFSLPATAQFGTADGTYNFSGLGRHNSGGGGFKNQRDKFKVSNIFSQDGTSIYADNNNSGASQTVIIKAEGGTVNKSFTFKNLLLRNYSTIAALDMFTITLRDRFGANIATHSLAGAQSMTLDPTGLSGINFTAPFPASGYAGVAEIQIDFHYADGTIAPNELTFDNITIANVKATGILPLNLVEFFVKKEGSGVRINWKTAKEENIERLILEHSADGIQFASIASFGSFQHLDSIKPYTHYHATPIAGRNYYRLKEKNQRGEEKIYTVKSIDLSTSRLSIMGSNPVSGPLLIKGLSTGVYDLQLTDMSGRVVLASKILAGSAGSYSLVLPPAIHAGTYLLTVKGQGEQVSSRLIKE